MGLADDARKAFGAGPRLEGVDSESRITNLQLAIQEIHIMVVRIAAEVDRLVEESG
jgi:hypothetical protein